MKKILQRIVIGITVFILAISFGGIASAQKGWEAHPPVHSKKASSSIPVGYIPSQIKKAYGLDQLTATGSGQTIAIVDAYGSPTIQNDLTKFSTQFNLPPANLIIAYPGGNLKKTDSGWALETSLDVEWAHAIAPNATILLCVAKSASLSDLIAAVDYANSHGAQVVSNSWGGAEFSGEASYDLHFQQKGTTYVASSGDSGSGAEWPASSPYVLAVGGTTLKVDSTGATKSETAWSGSGGGRSAYQPIPSYQNNWKNVVGAKRGIPDIAWDADPNTGVAVYDTTSYSGQNGWFQIGGTSVGAPCLAAMIALSNQNRVASFTNFDVMAQLYNAAGTTASAGYVADYNDITQGSNGGYSAQLGYDLVTGIGSPHAKNLVPFLTSAP